MAALVDILDVDIDAVILLGLSLQQDIVGGELSRFEVVRRFTEAVTEGWGGARLSLKG